jgi:signal transduction histidine kinase
VDAEVAERVLAPVIANALQFASHEARVELERDDVTVRFAVYDDGPGVPASEREAIFQAGYRGMHARNGAGTGLGLALARRLARAADGSIEYADSAFVISLPTA